MVQKTFFRVRSVAERRKLSRRRIYTAKNLVDRILEGDMEDIIAALRAADQAKKLEQLSK